MDRSEFHLQAGDAVEQYQLIELLDRRRGIDVWRGQHVSQQTQVALKMLVRARCSLEQCQRCEQRLRNEALVLTGLRHPHILGFRDYFEQQDYCALVLEYAASGSVLARHGSGRRLPLALVRLYATQIGGALDTLQQRRLIHCDVKPGNILLAQTRHALLADFGVAMYAYVPMRIQGGTPHYMAPEQYEGAPCAASDQYALAVCVYEWLTGHLPFSGGPQGLLRRRQRTIPRSVCIFRPELPTAVDRILRIALHPDPLQRYPSAGDFASEFARITRTARPPLVRRIPYYRSAPYADVARLEEQCSISTHSLLPDTAEREAVRPPILLPAMAR